MKEYAVVPIFAITPEMELLTKLISFWPLLKATFALRKDKRGLCSGAELSHSKLLTLDSKKKEKDGWHRGTGLPGAPSTITTDYTVTTC